MAINNTTSISLDEGNFGVGQYISLDRKQQDDILNILDLCCNYIKREKAPRPLNIYLEASPGSGKSFLVKQIYKSLEKVVSKKKTRLLNFNITNMRSFDQLSSAFNIVQSLNIEGKIPIVFFDEVDSKLDGTHDTYPFFLTPMFDGKITTSGIEYNIGSAIFFFAASKQIKKIIPVKPLPPKPKKRIASNLPPPSYEDWVTSEDNLFRQTLDQIKTTPDDEKIPKKISDFLDRIDSFIFIPPSNVLPNKRTEDLKKQSDIMVCSMLLRHFPNVRKVDIKVLGLLSSLLMKGNSLRGPDSIIFKSTTPSDNYFRTLHLPFDTREKYINEISEIPDGIVELHP